MTDVRYPTPDVRMRIFRYCMFLLCDISFLPTPNDFSILQGKKLFVEQKVRDARSQIRQINTRENLYSIHLIFVTLCTRSSETGHCRCNKRNTEIDCICRCHDYDLINLWFSVWQRMEGRHVIIVTTAILYSPSQWELWFQCETSHEDHTTRWKRKFFSITVNLYICGKLYIHVAIQSLKNSCKLKEKVCYMATFFHVRDNWYKCKENFYKGNWYNVKITF